MPGNQSGSRAGGAMRPDVRGTGIGEWITMTSCAMQLNRCQRCARRNVYCDADGGLDVSTLSVASSAARLLPYAQARMRLTWSRYPHTAAQLRRQAAQRRSSAVRSDPRVHWVSGRRLLMGAVGRVRRNAAAVSRARRPRQRSRSAACDGTDARRQCGPSQHVQDPLTCDRDLSAGRIWTRRCGARRGRRRRRRRGGR